MKRSILALLLAVCMLVCIAPCASAAGAAFVVDVPSGSVAAGESFDVTVSLRDNPGFYALEFNLVYDEDALECTKVTEGPLVEQMLFITNPKGNHGAIVTGASAGGVTGDGVVATFSFKAKKAVNELSFKAYESDIASEAGEWMGIDVVWIGSGSGQTSPQPGQSGGGSADPVFTDIAGHWGEQYIIDAAKRGLINGYGDGRFGPDDKVTRAQFVTVLYRMSGSPATSAKTPFADIASCSEEFKKAIAWAYEKGHVNGYVNEQGETVFNPNGNITRQEAMKILFYYSGGKSGMELMLYSTYDGEFSDSGSIAAWARPAMYWGVYNKIISGTGAGLAPQDNLNRAQMAKILVNYLDRFK